MIHVSPSAIILRAEPRILLPAQLGKGFIFIFFPCMVSFVGLQARGCAREQHAGREAGKCAAKKEVGVEPVNILDGNNSFFVCALVAEDLRGRSRAGVPGSSHDLTMFDPRDIFDKF
jgi:hypothetical protein